MYNVVAIVTPLGLSGLDLNQIIQQLKLILQCQVGGCLQNKENLGNEPLLIGELLKAQ
jgi:hypothetical protein